MFDTHHIVKSPADENVKIWRYVDFSKLVSLLHSKALHFTRLDSFGDKFEGTLPKRVVETIQSNYEASHIAGHSEAKILEQLKLRPTVAAERMRERLAVNCWHMNEHESAAMWAQYLKSDEGIAIQSTYRRLADAFDPSDRGVMIYIGNVIYIDYDKDNFDFTNTLTPATHKRASFRHEQEIRAIAVGLDKNRDGIVWDLRDFPESGIDVAVSVEKLISAVYVAPGSPVWFKASVESVITKYGLSVPIISSSLDADPVW